ncbi:TIGR01777 family oxidoreductase [Simiduia sp. 21SJ11W-1]|uniref:TIGR01777 family oxidoreductase n=1 Tax=Simiduia sp. 21SJ11W-1 TaxID=2909669 RepID=UPI00209DBDC4|nr:TIGR01777 family oxidoreductase [Simiduia sp. 21SJ11W-1]UTA47277.1 TIGR01777 family oxidoreductase [Simiduia sp. 21SJ11W-1]
MHILVTGATGMIGKALVQAGLFAGHTFTLWVRNPAKARRMFGNTAAIIHSPKELDSLAQVDWVFNLAGLPIADKRWSAKRKAELLASRLEITGQLANWINRQPNANITLLSGSAVGVYGNTRESVITEQSPLPDAPDFAASLCQQWEASARQAHKARTIILRTGLVLGPGGLLKKLRPVFTACLGGNIGCGEQFMPWIHIEDQVRAMLHLAGLPEAEGAYNLCAPHPVTNAEFTRELANALRRPAVAHLPTPLVKWVFGELSALLLGGQNTRPARLQASGFRFAHPDLHQALPMVL